MGDIKTLSLDELAAKKSDLGTIGIGSKVFHDCDTEFVRRQTEAVQESAKAAAKSAEAAEISAKATVRSAEATERGSKAAEKYCRYTFYSVLFLAVSAAATAVIAWLAYRNGH
jgi:hypothetical protein